MSSSHKAIAMRNRFCVESWIRWEFKGVANSRPVHCLYLSRLLVLVHFDNPFALSHRLLGIVHMHPDVDQQIDEVST
jgi:hypothetical protein